MVNKKINYHLHTIMERKVNNSENVIKEIELSCAYVNGDVFPMIQNMERLTINATRPDKPTIA